MWITLLMQKTCFQNGPHATSLSHQLHLRQLARSEESRIIQFGTHFKFI